MILNAPERPTSDMFLPEYTWVFAGGGITGTQDWQSEYCLALDRLYENLVVVNPRRADYPHDDPSEEDVQVKWEFDMLAISHVRTFYFAPERIQPITLYEYGKWLPERVGRHEKLFVAIHPDYPKRHNLLQQTRLERPDIQVWSNIEELTAVVGTYLSDVGHRRRQYQLR